MGRKNKNKKRILSLKFALAEALRLEKSLSRASGGNPQKGGPGWGRAVDHS